MTSALYLEQYLDSLEHLPIELQRNFTLMRDLDSRAQTLMRTIDSQADEYLKNQSTLSQDQRKEQLDKIQSLFNKAKEYGDDKVQLAIQTYELVDKHIRRLDSDLARFETEIQDKAANSRSQDESQIGKSKQGRKKTKDGKSEKKKRVQSSEEEAVEVVKGNKKKKHKGVGATGITANSVNSGAKSTTVTDISSVLPITHTSDVLDMPVDPNEPTYCLCHQVSYGEMIGCDNPDCPIEWFHFACVGLTTKPKGKWYCPKCTQDRKKK
ncbi:inhibitor of growth protein 5 isoform X2 [Onthophagus taurus]|uniref:inhibitor of growth protein 5 isoform X2 n=1 Tax=Onthophagus taurus TaxID=166361 RepID=UPI000C207D5F|nr:inhibitor of growth protein 5 [Onthophagus taurus]